jgi:selenocysteine lyase/cysteine desulfurase
MKQELAEAVERAYAIAYALARLEGASDAAHVEAAIGESVSALSSQLNTTPQHNVVTFRKADGRAHEVVVAPPRDIPGGVSAQELILATVRDHEASIKELQNVLEDHGLEVTPGNLSVILSRMTQVGSIQRAGRGLYKYAG